MKKISKMNEAAWIIGTLLCALGRVLCTKSGFGLSMIGAPPYIIHLKLAEKYPFFTQGTSEYVFQAFLFILVCAMLRSFRVKHLLSFLTAVILGIVIDGWLFVFGGNYIYDALWLRILSFVLGELFTALSIAFLFRTSLPLQMYEVFVLEIASKFNIKKDAVKLWFDVAMLILSVLLALMLNGNLEGVGIGTIIITVVNAPLIKLFGGLLDRLFIFNLCCPSLGKVLK
ncbi:MAG: hypothetical protein IKB93_10895 [Clostridia bacterium]|nr:hypothetical protein [Clostridia bacterium]